MVRLSRVLALSLVAVVAVTGGPPAAAQDGPCLATVSPDFAFVGQELLLTGSGFTPGAAPTLLLEGPEGTSSLDLALLPDTERYRVREDGTFGPLDLSNGPSGDEPIDRYAGTTLVTLSEGSCVAEATFIQAALLSWEPVSGLAGLGDAVNPGGVAVSDDGVIVVVAGTGLAAGSASGPGLVWTSSDSVAWDAVELPAAEGVVSMEVASTPIGFIATGFSLPADGDPAARAWASDDGRAWRELVLDSPRPIVGPLRPMATVDGAALLGSVTDPSRRRGKRRTGRQPLPAVWRSTDAETWTLERLGRRPGSTITGTLHAQEPWVLTTDATARRPGLVAWHHDGVAWQRSRRGIRTGSSFDARLSLADGADQLFVTNEVDARRSSDGSRWRRAPALDGFAGALGGFGHVDAAVMALDEAGASISFDGETWLELPTDAFAGHRIIDFAELPDGRILAIGQSGETSAMGAWIGRPGG